MPHEFLAPATEPPKPEKPIHMRHATPPPTPGERAKWEEHVLDRDPKAEADRRRDAALGGEAEGEYHEGVWTGRMSDATRALVRGPAADPRDDESVAIWPEPGIDDDVPALPPPLAETTLKPRWEAFCRLYAYGHSAADAARHAGYAWESAGQSGWRLLQDDRVRDRIAEFQRYLSKTLVVEERDLMLRAEAIYREAMNRGHYGAALRALEFSERVRFRRAAKQDEKSDAPGGA